MSFSGSRHALPKAHRENERGKFKNFKPKAWNHQDELKALRGQQVQFALTTGTRFAGELLEADSFTVKVKCDDGAGGFVCAVVYKSSLTSFQKV